MLPLAIQYGMTPQQFWHEDTNLLRCYQRAYYEDKSFTAWLGGFYNYIGVSISMSMLGLKKGEKPPKYPEFKPMFEKQKHEHMSEEELNQKQIDILKDQNEWLKNLLKKDN